MYDPYDPMSQLGALSQNHPKEFHDAFTPYAQQESLLQEQLAQAEALMNRPRRQATTAKGAIIGGVGDIMASYAGGKGVAEAQAGKERLYGKMQDEAAKRMQLMLAEALRQKQEEGFRRGMTDLQGSI